MGGSIMKFIRTRGFTADEGKFSIWEVILSPNEIKNYALKHPQNLTYNMAEKFKVYMKVDDGASIKIRLVDQIDDEKVIKECSFTATVDDTNDEDIPKVIFNSQTNTADIVLMNSDISEKPFTYIFATDFLGYKTGSFYRLFSDVFKYGYFATVDGKAIVEEATKSDLLHKERLENLRLQREKIKEDRKKSYDSKNEEKKATIVKKIKGTKTVKIAPDKPKIAEPKSKASTSIIKAPPKAKTEKVNTVTDAVETDN
jgi:hypothetical protein